MAPKKASKRKKTSKKGTNSLIFPLVILVVILVILYYIFYQLPNQTTNDSIKPFKKKTEKKIASKSKSQTADTLKNVVAEIQDTIQVADTTKIPIPKPSIREKSKLYFVDPKLPKICIIVDDFGQNDNALISKFLDLDKNIALSVMPNLKNSISIMKKAVQLGHEVLIHTPLEPESYPKDNPGELAIFVQMSDEDIKKRIESYIYQLNYAVGINHHMGSKAASDLRVMRIIMKAVKENGLFYIDSYTGVNSVVEQVANEYKVPFAKRQVFLDVPETSKHRAILKLEEMKKIKTPVITVITHCHNDVKLRQLEFFIDRLKDQHYQLIPPSKAVKLYPKPI